MSATSWAITLGDDTIDVDDTIDGRHWSLPVGHRAVRSILDGDPPSPEQLSNAIGLVEDHLDDVVRDTSHVIGAAVVLCGPHVGVVADVEHGGSLGSGAHLLPRSAAEEVFRTLVTESRAERRLNPGLPDDHVDTVVATCCMIVGVMRRLQLDSVLIEAAA